MVHNGSLILNAKCVDHSEEQVTLLIAIDIKCQILFRFPILNSAFNT